ncbi:hypothetical protein DPMN_058033 [Dreissena polymorpha]|uniref:Uncharacterized protein n=1 Tax=Dreissena polymorpha TaxID=45954 RepID=A0A9D4C1C2_DREPO|nr:hypothetical protein DPMN_058033 [Dreissena polymorpha]
MFHNIRNNQVAIPIPYFLKPITRPSHTKAFQNIQTTTDYHKFSFFARTIIHWNAPPPDIVNLPGPEFSLAPHRIPVVRSVTANVRYSSRTVANVRY